MSVIGKPRDERGAVAPFVAVLIILLVGLASFAVDLGYQRVAARDMQAVADIVAMDMARQLDGTKGTVLKNTDRWKDAARASLARNDDQVVGDQMVVVPCGVDLNTLPDDKAVLCASPGVYDPVSEIFSDGGNQAATHVRVVTRTKIDYFFPMPGRDSDSGWVTKTAFASIQESVCYKASAFALGLASKDSILRGILGPSAGLRVLGDKGLANAQVSLLGVATELGAATPEDLVNLSHLTVGQFLDAAATVAANDGTTAGANLATSILGLKTDIGPLVGERLNLAQLIDLGQGGGSALDAKLGIVDLITGAAVLANKVNGVVVPGLNVVVPGVVNLTAKLWLVSPAKQGCNGGAAKSSQGYIELTGSAGLCNALLALCADISLRIDLAKATARTAVGWSCNTDMLSLTASDQALLNLRLKAVVRAILLFVPVEVARVDTGPGPEKIFGTYDLPLPQSYSAPGVETDSGEVGLTLANTDVTLLGGIPLGGILNFLSPVVDEILKMVTLSLLPSLGLTTAGADLTAVPEVSCESPKLAG